MTDVILGTHPDQGRIPQPKMVGLYDRTHQELLCRRCCCRRPDEGVVEVRPFARRDARAAEERFGLGDPLGEGGETLDGFGGEDGEVMPLAGGVDEVERDLAVLHRDGDAGGGGGGAATSGVGSAPSVATGVAIPVAIR